MIDRYSRKELKAIWSEENKYKIWLNIEIAAAEAMEKYKIIPKGVSSTVKKRAKINVKRIHQIESKVKHDVIAFLTSITEKAGIKSRYLHQGMTSSDILDTAFNIQLKQSGEILLKDIDELLRSIKKQAVKYKFTLCIGRSHGIHAEPITFGLKMLTFYQEFLRNKKRLELLIKGKSATDEEWADWRKQRNKIGADIEKAKKVALKKKADNELENSGNMHNAVKDLLGWRTGGAPEMLLYEGGIVREPKKMAEILQQTYNTTYTTYNTTKLIFA